MQQADAAMCYGVGILCDQQKAQQHQKHAHNQRDQGRALTVCNDQITAADTNFILGRVNNRMTQCALC